MNPFSPSSVIEDKKSFSRISFKIKVNYHFALGCSLSLRY